MLHDGQPKCDIFNRGSSYLHVARTATAAVDRSISPRRSAANRPAAIAAVDRQYRQTDGRTSERYVDSYVGNVKHELDRLVWVTNCSCVNDTNHHTSRHVALLITPSFSIFAQNMQPENQTKILVACKQDGTSVQIPAEKILQIKINMWQ